MPIKVFESEILEKKMLNPKVVHLKFSFPEGFEFKAGQYVSISRMSDGKKLRTPYSIAASPSKGFGEFYIKIAPVGKASQYMGSLEKGDKIEAFGPLGKFIVNEESKNKDLIFVSSGTGISAFISMIPSLLEEGFKNKIILLKGFKNENETLYDKEFSELAEKYGNFEFHNVLSQPLNNDFEDKGYAQDYPDKYTQKNFEGDYYLCGLKEMIADTVEKLKKEGVDESRIFFEKYN